jgi:excisionase family DNA binding protein
MGKKLSLDTAADHLEVSKRTLRRLISDGILPAYRLGRTRVIRVDADDLQKALRPVVPSGARDGKWSGPTTKQDSTTP